jgi:hypothetical protein
MRVVRPKAVPAGCDSVLLLKLIGKGTTGTVYKGQWVAVSSSDSGGNSAGASYSNVRGAAPGYVAVKVFGNFNCHFVQERQAGILAKGVQHVVQMLATGGVARPAAAAAASDGLDNETCCEPFP